tara:strand:- start:657 stop:869 length:213 start_codon:yes stop_codon:yes gene_type:complete
MIVELGYQISLLNVYSFSSTLSILIHGFPLGPPLLINLIILRTAIKTIGIHKIIAGLSIIKIKIIYVYKT